MSNGPLEEIRSGRADLRWRRFRPARHSPETTFEWGVNDRMAHRHARERGDTKDLPRATDPVRTYVPMRRP